MKYILRLFVFLAFASLLSCGREDSNTIKALHIEPINIQYFSKSSVTGQVLDQDFNPIANCMVTYEDFNDKSQKTRTDANGIFNIENKFLNENGQLLTFNKDDFFTQYAYIKPDKNRLTVVSVTQQQKNEERKISAKAENKEYFYNSTIECIIPPNSIVKENGNKYSGAFYLYCKSPFLKPNTVCYPDFGIPFSNEGINLNNQNTIVFPLFSTLVHIEDLNNNQLYFGNPITVKVKKDEVPCLETDNFILWHFDSKKGKWIAQNELNSPDKIVEFKVEKSGYYIITDKTDVILNVEGQIVYEDGTPADNTYIEVIEPKTGLLLGQYFSDNFGFFSFFKEQNKDVLLRIRKCDDSNFEYKITENDEDIGKITLPADFNNKYELTIDSPVSNGFLVLEQNDGYGYFTKFSVPVIDSTQQYLEFYGCDNEYLTLYDLHDLPMVKNSNPVYLYPGIQLTPDDLLPSLETANYLYVSINNKQEEFFNTNNYLYQDQDALILESPSSKKIAAIRYSKSDAFCHFAYIKFNDKNDFEVLETDTDNPLDFEIITDTDQQTTGHFYGNINSNGENKKIEGYFKISN